MTVGDAQAANAVPCGLLEGGKVTKSIKKGELITISNVSVDTKSRIYELRQLQDQMLKAAH
jgi:predicted homoserine dehydrogenase-like protein